MKTKHLLLTSSIILVLLSGCYNYRVVMPADDPATDYYDGGKCVRHAFLWGFVQPNAAITEDCNGGGIEEVKVSTNLGFSLINVVTIGIWNPVVVKWRCAKPCPEPDDGGL